jgi:hypothetical protein
MKRTECDRLEDFLGGWMPEADASEFERHLLQCEACRVTADLQQRLDKLLKETADVIDVPESLVERIEREIEGHRRPRAGVVAAAVAAGLLVMVFGTRYLSTRLGDWARIFQVEHETLSSPDFGQCSVAARHLPAESDKGNGDSVPKVVVDVHSRPGNETIAVPLPSKNPQITILMVYPAIRPSQSFESIPSNL